MLREEVLKGWGSLKEKINLVKLSPQDKATWKWLERSRTYKFSIYDRDVDLKQLEKDIEAEKLNCPDAEENDLLVDFWWIWSNYSSLILDWISLKRSIDSYKFVLEEKDEEINSNLTELERLHDIIRIRGRNMRVVMDRLKKKVKGPFFLLAGQDHNSIKVNFETTDKYLNELKTMINNFDFEKDILGLSNDEN